jgi:RNA polymerase sigma-70 factor (ECF subfamily)
MRRFGQSRDASPRLENSMFSKQIADDVAVTLLSTSDLAEVYTRYHSRLRSAATARVPFEDADDVVHDAIVYALRQSHQYRGEAAPAAWLYSIVTNRAGDVRRRMNRHTAAIAREQAVGHRSWRDHAAQLLERHALRLALARLPPSFRRVCILYDLLGYTHREISVRLGIPVGTSKRRLATSRSRLRRFLVELA